MSEWRELSGGQEPQVERLLDRLKRSGIYVIKPILDISSGSYVYLDAEEVLGTEGEETEHLLESMAMAGRLKKIPAGRVRTCPDCGSSRLDLVEGCPDCRSLDISGDGLLTCRTCSSKFSAPNVYSQCGKCGGVYAPNETKTRKLYSYELVEGGASRQESSRLVTERGMREELRELTGLVKSLSERLDSLLDATRPLAREETRVFALKEEKEVEVSMKLDDKLQKTYEIVLKNWSVTSEDVAAETGRSRALESMYLNQLVSMDLITRERVGRKVYFMPKGGHAAVMLFKPIIERLSSRGWVGVSPASITGSSGVKHIFVLASSPSTDVKKPQIVAAFVSGRRPADENHVLSFFAKALDVGAKNMVFMAIPSLSEKARKLAEFNGIRIVEATSQEEIVEALWAALEEIINEVEGRQERKEE